MFRKFAFALATTAALGAAALAPTAASAKPFGHHPHFGWGVGIAAGIVGSAIVADRCLQRETFHTRYGWRTRWVNVCY
jgi:hypothetical protein